MLLYRWDLTCSYAPEADLTDSKYQPRRRMAIPTKHIFHEGGNIQIGDSDIHL